MRRKQPSFYIFSAWIFSVTKRNWLVTFSPGWWSWGPPGSVDMRRRGAVTVKPVEWFPEFGPGLSLHGCGKRLSRNKRRPNIHIQARTGRWESVVMQLDQMCYSEVVGMIYRCGKRASQSHRPAPAWPRNRLEVHCCHSVSHWQGGQKQNIYSAI